MKTLTPALASATARLSTSRGRATSALQPKSQPCNNWTALGLTRR
jgi:hypothetical protein